MRKKFIAGAAVLALFMSTPQVSADDDIVIFGSEFEDEATPPAPKKVEKPAPVKKTSPPKEKPVTVKPKEKPAASPKDEKIPPKPKKVEVVESTDKPQTKPQEKPVEPAQMPEENPVTAPEDDDDNFGEVLVFDDMSRQPKPQQLDPPEEPVSPEPEQPAEVPQTEIDKPFTQPTEISGGDEKLVEPVVVVPPPVTKPNEPTLQPQQPVQETPAKPQKVREPSTANTQPKKKLKTFKQRFVKLAIDDTYTYYLDKTSVQWRKMPYSSSEYVADVWIRMVERTPKQLEGDMAAYGEENFNAEVRSAQEQGYQYTPEDLQVLSHQSYVLEHYWLRPKTNQIQFFCELEVFGRPQNTINERAYDSKNWENLVPGSVESIICTNVLKIIGKGKSSEKGHMTAADILDEYLRIALN